MHPVLFTFSVDGHHFVVRAYATLYVCAWVAGLLGATLVARHRAVNWKRAGLTYAVSLVAGILGARLFDVVTHWETYASGAMGILDPDFRGFGLYGGLIVAVVGALVLCQMLRLPLWQLADCAVPGLVVGIVLMRVGCFLNGCCFGTPTTLPWGVTFPPGSPAWSSQLLSGELGLEGLLGATRPVHPTQLYEIVAACVLGTGALLLMRLQRTEARRLVASRRLTVPGLPFLAFALTFTLFRLANGFLRAELPSASTPGWFYPIVYLVLSAVAIAFIVVRVRTPEGHDTTNSQPRTASLPAQP